MQTDTCQQLAAQLGLDDAIGIHMLDFSHPHQLAELAWFAADGETLPVSLRAAVVQRQREFLAGRYCAARALAAAGYLRASTAPLAIDHDRVPCWPPGWCGSISHSTAAAIAVAAPAHAWRALGVDLEVQLDSRSVNEIEARIGSPTEWALLASLDRCRRVSLLFCAKEALYKALFPLVRCFQDFAAARLVAWDRATLVLQLSCSWGPDWPTGVTVTVRHAQLGRQVCTLVKLP